MSEMTIRFTVEGIQDEAHLEAIEDAIRDLAYISDVEVVR